MEREPAAGGKVASCLRNFSWYSSDPGTTANESLVRASPPPPPSLLFFFIVLPLAFPLDENSLRAEPGDGQISEAEGGQPLRHEVQGHHVAGEAGAVGRSVGR